MASQKPSVKTVFILGLGSAGTRYAQIAQKLGCQVFGYDANEAMVLPPKVTWIEANQIDDWIQAREAAGQLDLLLVCTPAASHYDDLIDFIPTGVPILCEKPLCETYEQALDLQTLCAEHDCQELWVGYQLRFLPKIQEILQIAHTQPIHGVYAAYKGNKNQWNGQPENYRAVLLECSHEIDLLFQAFQGQAPETIGYWNMDREGEVFCGKCDPNWELGLDWHSSQDVRKFQVDIDQGRKNGTLHLRSYIADLAQGHYSHMHHAYTAVLRRALWHGGEGLCTLEEAVRIQKFIDEVKRHAHVHA